MESDVNTGESAASDNRRRAYRQALVCKGMLYRDNRSAGPQRITLQDASMLGVGFDSAAPVEPGTRCRVQLELGPTRISWRLRVVCCGKIDDNLYRIGCDFVPTELDLGIPGEPGSEVPDDNSVLLLT
jgi:hypothetical protein